MSDDNQRKKLPKGVSRRGFLKLATGLGLGATGLSGCLVSEKQPGGKGWLPKQYENPGSWPAQVRGRVPIDLRDLAIVRDDKKCVLCGQCIEACQNIQSVYGSYELPIVDEIVCVHCGQCSLWCPTSAISERNDLERVRAALADPKKTVVIQTAPATRVGLGEEFGLTPGTWVEGQQVEALRQLGFDRVFDTNFAADLTVVEEASELVARLRNSSSEMPLPQITSCCPGWVKFLEYFYPELIPNLSTTKSPQQMMGALVKTYFARVSNIAPESIFSVSVMPCTAKKFEQSRKEFDSAAKFLHKPGILDIDAVITVRELALMLKQAKLEITKLAKSGYDSMLGESSGAGLLFGNTGGVTEATFRSAYFYATGQKAPAAAFGFKSVRGLDGIKEAGFEIPGFGNMRIAAVSGLKNARILLERIKAGEASYHFIEIMACPGGCISGGGMPRASVPPSDRIRRERINSIENRDASLTLRESHENSEIKALYAQFIGEPLGKISHELLHTKYISRSSHLKAKKGALR